MGPVKMLAGASKGTILILALDMSPGDEEEMSTDLFDKIRKYYMKINFSDENSDKTCGEIDTIMDKEFGKEIMKQFTVELMRQAKAIKIDDEEQIAYEAK